MLFVVARSSRCCCCNRCSEGNYCWLWSFWGKKQYLFFLCVRSVPLLGQFTLLLFVLLFLLLLLLLMLQVIVIPHRLVSISNFNLLATVESVPGRWQNSLVRKQFLLLFPLFFLPSSFANFRTITITWVLNFSFSNANTKTKLFTVIVTALFLELADRHTLFLHFSSGRFIIFISPLLSSFSFFFNYTANLHPTSSPRQQQEQKLLFRQGENATVASLRDNTHSRSISGRTCSPAQLNLTEVMHYRWRANRTEKLIWCELRELVCQTGKLSAAADVSSIFTRLYTLLPTLFSIIVILNQELICCDFFSSLSFPHL